MTGTLSEGAARERAAFVRRIVEEPGEDHHRLVFADWLEEHDQGERAEFIRVQVRLARLNALRPHGLIHIADYDKPQVRPGLHAYGCVPDCPLCEYDPLPDRERALWLSHGDLWPAPLPGWPLHRNAPGKCRTHWGTHAGQDIKQTIRGEWSRGFVGEVRCDLRTLLGGACERCDITNTVCPECGDPARDYEPTGRTPGIAAALFAAHPVLSVNLVGKEPYHDERGWFWSMYSHEDEAEGGEEWDYALPERLCDIDPKLASTVWDSEEDARSAASELCVRYGRKVAKLPECLELAGWRTKDRP